MTTNTLSQDDDSAMIHDVLDRLARAWGRGDAAGFARLFTRDADYTTNFGLTLHGRAEIEDGHRRLFDGPGRGTLLRWHGRPSIRFVRPDVAIVLAHGRAGGDASVEAEREAGGNASAALTYVMVRVAGRWLVASFQNTRSAPMPPLD